MSMKNFDKEKLISLVRAKRAIWDKSHPHHFNKGILHKHWQAIATELLIPEHVIKRQWKYLRQEFGRQLKRAATAAVIAPEEDDITSWPHYYSMLFVIDQFTSRGSEDANDSSSQPIEMLTPKIEVESAEESDDEQRFSNIQGNARSSHADMESDHSRASSPTSEPIPNVHLPVKKPLTTVPAQHQIAHLSAQSLATSSGASHNMVQPLTQSVAPKLAYNEYQRHRDDDVAFFDSILPHVKSLKMERKFQFRMQVQKLLYDMLFPPPNNQPNPEVAAEKLLCPEKSSGADVGYLARIVPVNK